MTIKQLRVEKGLSQVDCAKYLNIPYRTYCRYELNESKVSPIKYKYIIERLNNYGFIDEEHGVLTMEQIKEACSEVLRSYNAEYAYLFGSYAKGTAKETSDVDLLVSVSFTGLSFFELIEALREKLKKKVDVLGVEQLNNNPALLQEILRFGIKIYG